MMIERFTVTQYCMPIIKPLFIKKRSGAFVMLQDNCGIVGHGEVAPLPHYSKETLKEALEQLRQLERWMIGRQLPSDVTKLDGALGRWLPDLLPSVRCGIEMAILDLFSRQHGCTMGEVMIDSPSTSLSVASLLSADDPDMPDRARVLAAKGIQAIKIKVARQAVEKDVAAVQRVLDEHKGKLTLRLDANRLWEPEQALAFGKALQDPAIEYIEEPLADPKGLAAWAQETGQPLAIDETLQDDPEFAFENLQGLTAVVMKPTLIGGFERCMGIARRAHEKGIKAVVSASFETVRGLAALAHLASALPGESVAVGLDTGNWFTGPFASCTEGNSRSA